MMRSGGEAKQLAARVQTAAAITLAVGIFALDALTPLQGAVAVLYTAVVLVAARNHVRDLVIAAGTLCALLAIAAYVISHLSEPLGSPAMRLGVSLVAIGITTILTVRNQSADSERLRSDERYRTIFNAAGFPIWESDWSGAFAMARGGREVDRDFVLEASRAAKVRNANQAAAKLFGFRTPDDLVGATIIGHLPAAGEAPLVRIFQGLARGDALIEEETQLQTLSGEIIDIVLRVTLPPDHDGWKHVLVMALDVTERNRAQTRLAQSQAELAHISRLTTLGQLAASIAHEVNQPLSAIVTYADSGKRWLAREAPNATEVADCLSHVASNGARAAGIIARIRDMARKADPKRCRIALEPLIEETITLLQHNLQANEIIVRISVAPGLPAILGDRVQIQQVLVNLMLNAMQAMTLAPPGKREIRIEAAPDAAGVAIGVIDSGAGIAGLDPEALFNPFFTTKPEGMGMGLSICRSIIEFHGGTLTAANNPDGGATFSFNLPAGEMRERAAA